MKSRLFPALLRYWRTRRGLSQLELALEADVSARHVSFLESGRAQPSEDMLLRLFSVLGTPLRDQNEALVAAGFAARFPEPSIEGISPLVEGALAQMMAQHEPFPLTVLSLDGTLLRSNRAAKALVDAFVGEPTALAEGPDMYSLFFDPRLIRPFVVGWEALARSMLSRLHRDALLRGDARLTARLEHVLAYPGVPSAWRQPDFASDAAPTFEIRLERDDVSVGFLIAVTTFLSPRQVTLDELRIEACFPLDAPTRAACERLVARRAG